MATSVRELEVTYRQVLADAGYHRVSRGRPRSAARCTSFESFETFAGTPYAPSVLALLTSYSARSGLVALPTDDFAVSCLPSTRRGDQMITRISLGMPQILYISGDRSLSEVFEVTFFVPYGSDLGSLDGISELEPWLCDDGGPSIGLTCSPEAATQMLDNDLVSRLVAARLDELRAAMTRHRHAPWHNRWLWGTVANQQVPGPPTDIEHAGTADGVTDQ